MGASDASFRGTLAIPARFLILPGLTVVVIACGACGKRAFVPEEGAGATSASPLVVLGGLPPDAGASASLPPDPTPVPPSGTDDAAEPRPPSPLSTSCEGVSLVIASVTEQEHHVNAVVELRNGSATHVPLMLPGDGSGSGRRNPTLTFELSPNEVERQAGCGNMNALSADEIAFLAPASRTKLGWLSPPTPSKPGQYTLRATYRNDPTSERLGDNKPGPKTDKLIARARKTIACTLVSNTVSFVWKTPERVKGACTCAPGDPLCTCP